jgi:hypothetical protein
MAMLIAAEEVKVGGRQVIMDSVNGNLKRNFPKVKAGKASQKLFIKCAMDVAIWFANEVVSGRASLEVN